jgi:hypothetical protein
LANGASHPVISLHSGPTRSLSIFAMRPPSSTSDFLAMYVNWIFERVRSSKKGFKIFHTALNNQGVLMPHTHTGLIKVLPCRGPPTVDSTSQVTYCHRPQATLECDSQFKVAHSKSKCVTDGDCFLCLFVTSIKSQKSQKINEMFDRSSKKTNFITKPKF